MKKLAIIFAIISFFAFHTEEVNAKSFQAGVGFNYFYSSLTPYGRWVEIDGGLVVWRPNISNRHWLPYDRGTWIWTNDGWYWDSYEPFGYIVYHYGRWHYDDYYGWIWVPDYQWAPAWVEWRYDDDYIGWAPLPPYAVFNIHSGIHFSINFSIPFVHWHFLKYKHFGHHHAYDYYVGPQYKERIFNDTKVRNDYGYDRNSVINRGVDFETVRNRGAKNIERADLVRRNAEGSDRSPIVRSGNRIEVFTPRDADNSRDRNYTIERGDRNSSLKVDKVEVGERRSNLERSTRETERAPEVKRSQIERNDQPQRNVERQDQQQRPNREADVNRQREERQAPAVKEQQPERKREVQAPRENKPAERAAPSRERAPREKSSAPSKEKSNRGSDNSRERRR